MDFLWAIDGRVVQHLARWPHRCVEDRDGLETSAHVWCAHRWYVLAQGHTGHTGQSKICHVFSCTQVALWMQDSLEVTIGPSNEPVERVLAAGHVNGHDLPLITHHHTASYPYTHASSHSVQYRTGAGGAEGLTRINRTKLSALTCSDIVIYSDEQQHECSEVSRVTDESSRA